MRVLIQRIARGSVKVGQHFAAEEIQQGLMIFLGIGKEDTQEQAEYLAKKISNLRIFGDEQGKMNLSVKDVGGKAIVVSQFTLYANTKKGNRPSFIEAGPPEQADKMVDYFANLLREQGVPTQQGEFGAEMKVELVNDGPVTIWMEI